MKKARTKLADWQLKGAEGGECAKCGVKVSKLTVDHIIPAHFLRDIDPTGDMAFEWVANFQYLCSACNSNKGNSLDRSNPLTLMLLSDLVSMLYIQPMAITGHTLQPEKGLITGSPLLKDEQYKALDEVQPNE